MNDDGEFFDAVDYPDVVATKNGLKKVPHYQDEDFLIDLDRCIPEDDESWLLECGQKTDEDLVEWLNKDVTQLDAKQRKALALKLERVLRHRTELKRRSREIDQVPRQNHRSGSTSGGTQTGEEADPRNDQQQRRRGDVSPRKCPDYDTSTFAYPAGGDIQQQQQRPGNHRSPGPQVPARRPSGHGGQQLGPSPLSMRNGRGSGRGTPPARSPTRLASTMGGNHQTNNSQFYSPHNTPFQQQVSNLHHDASHQQQQSPPVTTTRDCLSPSGHHSGQWPQTAHSPLSNASSLSPSSAVSQSATSGYASGSANGQSRSPTAHSPARGGRYYGTYDDESEGRDGSVNEREAAVKGRATAEQQPKRRLTLAEQLANDMKDVERLAAEQEKELREALRSLADAGTIRRRRSSEYSRCSSPGNSERQTPKLSLAGMVQVATAASAAESRRASAASGTMSPTYRPSLMARPKTVTRPTPASGSGIPMPRGSAPRRGPLARRHLEEEGLRKSLPNLASSRSSEFALSVARAYGLDGGVPGSTGGPNETFSEKGSYGDLPGALLSPAGSVTGMTPRSSTPASGAGGPVSRLPRPSGIPKPASRLPKPPTPPKPKNLMSRSTIAHPVAGRHSSGSSDRPLSPLLPPPTNWSDTFY